MSWKVGGRLIAVAGLIIAFQNCGGLEHPTGENSATGSSMLPDDIYFLSVPSDVTLYTGSQLNLSVQAESKHKLPISYKWLKDGHEMNITTSAYVVPSVAATDGGVYTAIVSNSKDSEGIQIRVTISPIPVLTITTQPMPQTLVEGTAGQLAVVASTTPAQTLTYQWYKDSAPVAGGTSATLSLGASGIARAGNYYVKVSTTTGPLQTANSNTVKITHQQTYSLGADGCINGYCACVTPGQLYLGYQPAAQAICAYKGFAIVTTFMTVNGLSGARHCGPDGNGCFTNANPGNVTCSSVTCEK